MYELVSKLDSGELLGLAGMMVGVVAILGGITIAITKVVAAHYRRTQLDEMEATLKMEMIQRGMNADDIKKVLEAKMGAARGTSLNELLGGFPNVKMPSIFGKEPQKS